jgi:hypothetical protein
LSTGKLPAVAAPAAGVERLHVEQAVADRQRQQVAVDLALGQLEDPDRAVVVGWEASASTETNAARLFLSVRHVDRRQRELGRATRVGVGATESRYGGCSLSILLGSSGTSQRSLPS